MGDIFRRKSGEVQALRWLAHGDHDLVRAYAASHPAIRETLSCCGRLTLDHGWMHTPRGGAVVCPGDWIVLEGGDVYPYRADVFDAKFESSGSAVTRDELVEFILGEPGRHPQPYYRSRDAQAASFAADLLARFAVHHRPEGGDSDA